MKKAGIYLFLFILISLNTQGQDHENSWSLQKCIDYAMEHNLDIKQQKLEVQRSETMLERSKADFIPDLNAQVNHAYTFGRSVDRYTNTFTNTNVQSNNFYVGSSVTLFNGFQRKNTINGNQYSLQANIKLVEDSKKNIALQVALAFMEILYQQERVEVTKKQHEIALQQIAKTKVLVESGVLARGDLLEISSQAASDELEVVNAQNDLELAVLNLTQLLELDSVGNFRISTPDLPEISPEKLAKNMHAIYQDALQTYPLIQSSEFSVKSYEHELAAAKAGRIPSLDFSAYYYTGYSNARKLNNYVEQVQQIGWVDNQEKTPVYSQGYDISTENYAFFDQLKDNANTQIQFSLNIPIFNNYQIRKNISVAKINKLQSETQLEMNKKQLYKSIQQAAADAKAALKKYESAKKAEEAYQESFTYTQEKFNVGLVNTIEFNTAKNELAEAQSNLLQAKYEFIFKTQVLEFYRGNDFNL